jgi:hypothetical protein
MVPIAVPIASMKRVLRLSAGAKTARLAAANDCAERRPL